MLVSLAAGLPEDNGLSRGSRTGPAAERGIGRQGGGFSFPPVVTTAPFDTATSIFRLPQCYHLSHVTLVAFLGEQGPVSDL